MKRKKSQAEGSQRKRWGSPEKLRVVLAGLEPGVEISDLCRREGLTPALYYLWKRTMLGAADRIFEKKEQKPSAREERLTAQLTRAKDVIAEITAEKLAIKLVLRRKLKPERLLDHYIGRDCQAS